MTKHSSNIFKHEIVNFNILFCVGPEIEYQECFTEEGCTQDEIEGFLGMGKEAREKFQKHLNNWSNSRKDEALTFSIHQGALGYLEQTDPNSTITKMFKYIDIVHVKFMETPILKTLGLILLLILSLMAFRKVF